MKEIWSRCGMLLPVVFNSDNQASEKILKWGVGRGGGGGKERGGWYSMIIACTLVSLCQVSCGV